MRVHPYFAFGRRQLRAGWKTHREIVPGAWSWKYRFIGLEWQ